MNNSIGREYIRLAFQIEQHVAGFIDGYFGPPELKAEAESAGKLPVAQLQARVAALQEAIATADMETDRRDFLLPQVRAMATILRRLAGEELSLVEEAQGCFDITPRREDEAGFEAALRELDTLLPGHGNLTDRMEAWDAQFILPPEQVLPAMERALAEVRRRTLALFDLPAGEAVELEIVTNQPWSGYNWYRGGYRSLVQTNTDLPVKAHHLPELMAHEAYPGHHTEHALKEARLYQEADRLENSILLLLAPESTVAEAIATVAAEVIFPTDAARLDWLGNEFYPALGIEVDVEQQLRIERGAEKLAGVGGNAAFYLYEDGWSDERLVAYFMAYGLSTEKRARQRLRFIANADYRAYIFNYFYGKKLLKQAMAVGGGLDVFRWALNVPVTPTALAQKAALS